eukprot:s1032_g21.t1
MTQAASMASYEAPHFYVQLHELLSRLSPPCRKAALEQLTISERQGLEAWMLSSKSYGRGQARCNGIRPSKTSCRASMRMASSGAGSSVVTFSQRTLKGTTRWYYAVVCLPGLHILSRMRRERALAVDDSKVLTCTKRSVSEAAKRGHSFDEAVREALTLHSGSSGTKRKRQPKAGGTALEPRKLQLRFYAAVELGGGFSTMLRAPCCYDLEEALSARSRLQDALNLQGSALTSLSFSHCTEVLERLRCTHRALYQEAVGAADASDRSFGRVQRLVLQKREKRGWDQLRRLLRKRRAEVGACADRSCVMINVAIQGCDALVKRGAIPALPASRSSVSN